MRTLLDVLKRHVSAAGDGKGFKAAAFTDAANELAKTPPEKGGIKTASACKNKWGKVCFRVHSSTLIDIF